MTAKEIDARLRALADERFASGQKWFFNEEFPTYGVRAPQVHALSREVYAAVKKWPKPQRDRLMEDLWKLDRLEAAGLVCYVYRRFSKECGEAEFRMFTRWIDRYAKSWAHTDGVGTWLLAACLANEPALIERLPPWTSDKNRWKRRASAVAMIQEAKKGRHTEEILAIADRLLDDRDDMVEKGVGWLLKETYPKKPRETVAFLLSRRTRASRTTLRYAAEKMTARDRATVLARP